jgi:MFS family permease
MISRHALSFTVIKQAFSIISILVIVAPMLSSYLAMAMNHFHWRLAFAMMAIIEVFTLIYAMRILKHEDTSYRYTTISALLLGFVDCIKQKYYFLNMLIVGIGLSIFMQIFMGNIHALLIHQSTFLLSVTIFVMNFAYIAGILFFRHGPHFFAENKIRAFLLALFFFITLIFSWSSYLFLSLGSIFCICFIVGFLVPLSTTNGMSVIKKNHGAASGLFTFSFACISSLFAGVQAQTGIPPHLFMSLGLWICLLAMIMICVHLRKNDSCKPS